MLAKLKVTFMMISRPTYKNPTRNTPIIPYFLLPLTRNLETTGIGNDRITTSITASTIPLANQKWL